MKKLNLKNKQMFSFIFLQFNFFSLILFFSDKQKKTFNIIIKKIHVIKTNFRENNN